MSISSEIKRLGPWFHNLHLPDGTQTAPDHWLGDFPAFKWKLIESLIPADLTDWRALDVGCNAGFYTFELAKRGAQVTAIDLDEHYLAQAEWASRQFGLEERIEFRKLQVYDLAHIDEQYDIVLFMGVFYHLRYPLLGLDIVSQKVGKMMVFQTLSVPGDNRSLDTKDRYINERGDLLHPEWPKMSFIENRFAGDPTNWWVANVSGIKAMLRSSGMRIKSVVDDETYICQPDPDHPSCIATWNASELQSAIGQRWKAK